jgi:hypothetical protein
VKVGDPASKSGEVVNMRLTRAASGAVKAAWIALLAGVSLGGSHVPGTEATFLEQASPDPVGPGSSLGQVAPGTSGTDATGADSISPGASLTVYLMTLGQGDAVWERFGHNALWIQDAASGWEAAFNWGIFDFDQVDFVPRLIRGTMLYRMAPWNPQAYLEQTRRENRSVRVQELALTPEQRWDLYTFVEWNARPENMYYRYDYYRDNCSTRVRDALDRVLGGVIREATTSDTTLHTYRWHTRRLLRDVPWAYVGIQTVLGPRADRPLTVWEEAFLPRRLMEIVRDVQVSDGAGGTRPLVVEERELLTTTRPPVPRGPPFAFPWFLLAGVLWGGGILALARRGDRLRTPGRIGLTLLGGGWALVASLTGALLLGAWLFTDHVFWYRNLNLLQMNPLFLPLIPAFLAFPFRKAFPRWGRDTAMAVGVVAGVGVLAGLLPGVGQANGEILALAVPLNLAVALAGLGLGRGRTGPTVGPDEVKAGGDGENGRR